MKKHILYLLPLLIFQTVFCQNPVLSKDAYTSLSISWAGIEYVTLKKYFNLEYVFVLEDVVEFQEFKFKNKTKNIIIKIDEVYKGEK